MFKVILLPLDGSSMAEHALAPAIAVARECRAGLQLVYARDVTTSGRRAKRTGEGIAPGYVDAIAREITTGTGLFADAVTVSGSAADAICQHARAVRADLIVMTSHGRTGIRRAWMGSVADAVVRESDLPVLMLREPSQDDWRAESSCRWMAPTSPRPFCDRRQHSLAVREPRLHSCVSFIPCRRQCTTRQWRA